MNPSQLINQTSGDVEIYTPEKITDAARRAMRGEIDLDPASCTVANQSVRAARFFTREDNGLAQSWACKTLWLNHPFHRGWIACDEHCNRTTCENRGFHLYQDIPSNHDWVTKLISERENFGAGCCITFASTSEDWFQPLMDFPQIYLSPRTNYRRPDGTLYRGAPKGSVVTLVKGCPWTFKRAFTGMGKLMMPA